MSGAADLWELYGVEALSESRYCRVDGERPPVKVRDRRRRGLPRCLAQQQAMSPEAVCGTRGADRLYIPGHEISPRRKLEVHAAHLSVCGGERRSSWAGVNRSTTCMVPLQSWHFGSGVARGSSGNEDAGADRCSELRSSLKQSGSSVARCRLARKPKLRMRTKPRGSRCRRKRWRNSSTGRLMTRFLLPCAESRQRKLT